MLRSFPVYLLILGVACSFSWAAEDTLQAWIAIVKADPLKEASLTVLGNECGTLSKTESDNLARQGKILKDAGDRALPAIAEIIPNKYCGSWFIGNAARYAAKFSLSPVFDSALRAHRDEGKFYRMGGNLQGLFDYYVVFGGSSLK